MKRRLLTGVLLMASVTLSGVALAQSSGSLSPKVLDTDGDGTVTSEELRATPDQQFSRLDRNKDGMLTTAELGADRNSSTTSLTRDEFIAAVPPMIDSHDANRDGQISADEMVQ